MGPAAYGTINNPSVGADAYIGPPYRTPCKTCHCEASAHTGCGNPFPFGFVQGYYGLPTTSVPYHFIYSSMAWVFPCWDLGSDRFSCSRASGVWRPSWFQRRRMPFKYFQFMPCFFSTVFS